MTADELTEELLRLSRLLDDALAFLRRETGEYAEAEDAYRMAWALAFLEAAGPVQERKAKADRATSDQRRRAHLSEGMRQAGLEAVRSRRAQLSALQTVANAHRTEAELARYGPAVEP